MPTALITGITGQDGGYLAEKLLAAGDDVHGLARPGEPLPPHLTALATRLTLHHVEFVDVGGLREVLRASAPDEVYNLAGMSSVAASWAEPHVAALVNGTAVAGLLQLCWEQQVETHREVRLLQASSAEIFAGSAVSPQDENTPLAPRSPYGASKAFAHHLVQVFRTRGLHAVNAILYNHESARRPETFVTRKITRAAAAIALGSRQPLVLGNLDAERDWGFAPEYVDAMVRMLRHDPADDFVVATGVSHSVADFVAAAFEHVNVDDWRSHVTVDPELFRPADATALVGRTDKAAEALGWRAQTPLRALVGHMVDSDLVELQRRDDPKATR